MTWEMMGISEKHNVSDSGTALFGADVVWRSNQYSGRSLTLL
jgi:hypothetical protein